jgi:hypothetical protein
MTLGVCSLQFREKCSFFIYTKINLRTKLRFYLVGVKIIQYFIRGCELVYKKPSRNSGRICMHILLANYKY